VRVTVRATVDACAVSNGCLTVQQQFTMAQAPAHRPVSKIVACSPHRASSWAHVNPARPPPMIAVTGASGKGSLNDACCSSSTGLMPFGRLPPDVRPTPRPGPCHLPLPAAAPRSAAAARAWRMEGGRWAAVAPQAPIAAIDIHAVLADWLCAYHPVERNPTYRRTANKIPRLLALGLRH
jgi:hypothetical protein